MISFLRNAEVRKKVLFSLFIILIYRLVTHIPVPGVNLEAIRQFISGNQLFGLFDLFSGGGFQNFSILTLGLGPYISASIIVQLFSKMIPSLEELQKEGEYGREKINLYTKLLSVPISLVQGYSIYFYLSKQGVLADLNVLTLVAILFSFIAGSMFLVWLGDLVSEYGVGQGTSLLIFVGIISQLPTLGYQTFTQINAIGLTTILLYAAAAVGVIVSVVLINEATRNIALEYGRSGVKSQKVSNYLPIKINQAGVIPIIFAVYIVLVPSLLSGPFVASSNELLRSVGTFFATSFNQTTFLYNALYFILVFSFTFFYTFMQFDPVKVADDIKKKGGFIPGIRPGKSTEKYLRDIILKITVSGALFLGLIAILPYIIEKSFGTQNLSIGGTSLLIVVSVILETVRQIQSMMTTRSYQNFLD